MVVRTYSQNFQHPSSIRKCLKQVEYVKMFKFVTRVRNPEDESWQSLIQVVYGNYTKVIIGGIPLINSININTLYNK